MDTRGWRAWKLGVLVAALATILPSVQSSVQNPGRSLKRPGPQRVRIRRAYPGVYSATATYTPFSTASPVGALANRTLRADAEKGIRDFARQAERDLRVQGRLRLPYEHLDQGTISLDRRDLASAYLTTYEFMAGAHGMTTYTTVNVGVVKGRPRRLDLGDLFRPGVPAAQVAAGRVKEHLRANPRAAWFAPGSDPTYLPKDADLINDFVITPAGLTFLIEPYIAGPYAVGTFFVKIPFTEFGDQLDARGPLRPVLGAPDRS